MPISGPGPAKPAPPMPPMPIGGFQRTPVTSPEPSFAEPVAPPAAPRPPIPPAAVGGPRPAPPKPC
ncbi:hypothetical protein ABH39_19805, partial [Mycobacterium haemophilum]